MTTHRVSFPDEGVYSQSILSDGSGRKQPLGAPDAAPGRKCRLSDRKQTLSD